MAVRRDPKQIAREIQAEVSRLAAKRRDKETGSFSKGDERAINAAINRLDKAWKQLSNAIHPHEFGRRKPR